MRCRAAATMFRDAANRSADMRTGLDSETEAVSAVSDFGAPTMKWFPWNREGCGTSGRCSSSERPHRPRAEVLDRLLEGIGAAIDEYGAICHELRDRPDHRNSSVVVAGTRLDIVDGHVIDVVLRQYRGLLASGKSTLAHRLAPVVPRDQVGQGRCGVTATGRRCMG